MYKNICEKFKNLKRYVNHNIKKAEALALTLATIAGNSAISNLIMSNLIEANAATITTHPAASSIASSEYWFSPGTSKSEEKVNEDAYIELSSDAKDGGKFDKPSLLCLSSITSANQHSGLGYRYNNIGTYDGQEIDMVITADIGILREPFYEKAVFGFSKEIPGIYAEYPTLGNITLTYSYYYHDEDIDQDVPIDIKGHLPISNSFMDPNMRVKPISGIEYAYIGDHIKSDSNGWLYAAKTCSCGDEKESTNAGHGITFLTSGSSFSFMIGHVSDDDSDPTSYYTFGGSSQWTLWESLFTGYWAPNVAFDTPVITQTVSANSVQLGDEYKYTFEMNIPKQPSDNPYTSLVIEDTLPEGVVLADQNLSVVDTQNSSYDDSFELKQEGQKVTITCTNEDFFERIKNAFYSKSYAFTLNVKVDENATFTPSENGVILSNTATVTTNLGTKTSNTVDTEVTFKIDTSFTGNGTISGITGSNGGSGVVDNIKGGSSQTVSWEAKDGGCISSVKVDGVGQTVDSYSKSGSYTFENINANHTVEVATGDLPESKITVTKKSDKENYNVGDTVTYQITVNQTVEGALANNVVVTDKDYTNGLDMILDSVSDVEVSYADGTPLNYSLYKISIEDGECFNVEFKSLEYNKPVRITVKGVIKDAHLAGKNIYNKVDITCDNSTASSSATANSLVYKPNITVSKTADHQNGLYNVNDTVTYTIEVSQTVEGAIANNVKIEEVLPNGLSVDTDSFKIYKNSISDANEITSGYNFENKSSDGWTLNFDKVQTSYFIVYTAKVNNGVAKNETIVSDLTAQAENFLDDDNNNKIIKGSDDGIEVVKPAFEITTSSDKNAYNVKDTINYTAKINQTNKDARANDVTVKVNTTNGVKVDSESIKVSVPANVSVAENGESFVITLSNSISDSFNVTYSATVEAATLSGKTVESEISVTASNGSAEPTTAKSEQKILAPQLEIINDIEFQNYNYNDTVNYTITLRQLEADALANDITITNVIDTQGVDLITDSIVVSGSDYTVYVSDSDISTDAISPASEVTSNNVSGSDIGFVSGSDVSNEQFNKQGFTVKTSFVGEELIIHYQAKLSDKNLCGETFSTTASATSSNYLDENGNMIIEKDTVVANVYEPVLSIEKIADKKAYNLYDTIHFNVKAVQTAENAKAMGVVINDSFINDGIEIDPKTIVVAGYNESDYSIEFTGNGYEIGFNVPVALGDEINISYDAKIVDPALVGSTLTHEVYASCVTNTNLVGVWKDSVEFEVFAPEVTVNMSSDKSEAHSNEKVHYTIVVSQTDIDASAFNLKVDDVVEDNMSIDMDSITVSASDINTTFSSVEIVATDNGFITNIPEISGGNSVTISYDAIVLNENKETSTNAVSVTGDAIETAINDEVTIKILKTEQSDNPGTSGGSSSIDDTPKTGEANTVAVASGIALMSLIGATSLAYFGKKKFYIKED